ncbi:hypothetical protein FB45DRAFT_749875 [Roridomyces roridus]|uniref:DUF6589 domain-containing protein n=1 Tax=Roridomyces roridus TaxID=1738132 RepID=A0AAD7BPF0_9AGAR|nr:hypothetical protein FB45DRAFT_749875 [Roridomyces roridus]
MDSRKESSKLKAITAVDAEFIESWGVNEDEDATPFLTSILVAASQTARAKRENTIKTPERMCRVVTQQLLYQRSNRCMGFQAVFGLFLWSTGCARQTIDALFRCGMSVSYDSVLHSIQSLASHSMLQAVQVAAEPHAFCYDNVNISTSIFVEQRGAAGPAKVTSGTFGILYKLRNARADDMLIAPMMQRFKLSKGLQFNRDIKPGHDDLLSFHDQLIVTVIQRMFTLVPAFEKLANHPDLQYIVRRAIPVGYRILFHDDIYLNQLKRTAESLSKYAIPSYNDQLTNARIRSAQIERAKDTNAWNRREVFQLAFGLFHLCLNLVWAILHVHRGKINEVGSLSYFFSVMEKVRLGNDQPDYHSLLTALEQVLDGLLLNAWARECDSPSLDSFAKSKPTPQQLRDIAGRILVDYATPAPPPHPKFHPKRKKASAASDTESNPPTDAEDEPLPLEEEQEMEDIVLQNTRILTRDLLIVAALVRAISDGDIGRVQVMLPHLAMMFRGSGCNKYCTEILHFIHNLRHVWTPEFAGIMLDNMIICISGRGPGHCMPMDLNIEHLIKYLKGLLHAKGMDTTWDRLGDISAAIVPLQRVKKIVTTALGGSYQGSSHTTPDTGHLVWRVQKKAAEEELQTFQPSRSTATPPTQKKDILYRGERLLQSSTLKTFNKKIAAMIEGRSFEEEVDDLPTLNYSDSSSTTE